jgi:YVTN family beta-propeller protein
MLDGAARKVQREVPTGMGAHGLYLSRDATKLYVTNRHEGSVSVLDAYTGNPVTKWQIPGGGSPDMGNVTADGTQPWLSGRNDRAVYVRIGTAHLSEAPTARCISVSVRPSYRGHLHATP